MTVQIPQNSLNEELFNSLMAEVLPEIKQSTGTFSFGLVNSTQNGKRFSISKALAEQLQLTDSVYVMPSAATREVVIGKTLPFPSSKNCKLKGDGKKLCYSASVVELLTKVLNLDFSLHVSITAKQINLCEIEGMPVAVAKF